MIKVLIVDDSRTARAALRAILEKDSEILVVGEAANGTEALQLIHRYDPHFVTMDIFDNLISNSDRNLGNMLIDTEWKLWMIDHTRAFQSPTSLLDDEVMTMRRSTWERLVGLEESELRARLSGLLTPIEIRGVWQRRQLLLDHLGDLIAKHGEGAILYE